MKTLVKSNGGLIDVPQFFDDVFTRDMFSWPVLSRLGGDNLPAVNISETENSYSLEVAAPGMQKNDFLVELDNDTLIVSAKSENSSTVNESKENYTRREFNYKSFNRTFNLPEKLVKGENITARYENGILHILIPKTEEAITKPVKQIQIS